MSLERLGTPWSVCSTLAVLSAGIIGLFTLGQNCLPFDLYRLSLTAGMSLAFVGIALLLPGPFYLKTWEVTFQQWLFLALILAAAGALAALTRLLLRRVFQPLPSSPSNETEATSS